MTESANSLHWWQSAKSPEEQAVLTERLRCSAVNALGLVASVIGVDIDIHGAIASEADPLDIAQMILIELKLRAMTCPDPAPQTPHS